MQKTFELTDDSLWSKETWRKVENELGCGTFYLFYNAPKDKLHVKRSNSKAKGEELITKFILCKTFDYEVFNTVKSAVKSLELICKSTAKKLIGKKVDTAHVWCYADNPHYKCSSQMVLYHKKHIMSLA